MANKLTRRIFQWAKYGILLGLFTVAVLSVGRWITRAKLQKGSLSTVQKALYRLASFPSDFNTLLQNPGKLTAPDRVENLRKPEGPLHFVGQSPIPIRKKLLATYFDHSSNEYVAFITQLATADTLEKWTLSYSKAQKAFEQWQDRMAPNREEMAPWAAGMLNNIRQKKLRKTGFSHPVPTSHGQLLFNLPIYGISGPLACLDKNSEIAWVSDRLSHHGRELAPDGTLWSCSALLYKRERDSLSPWQDHRYNKDQIAQFTPAGDLLFKANIETIMQRHPQHDWSRCNIFDDDNYHLNDVQPVPGDGPYWKEGDVFVSLRHSNTVFLYRPSKRKVLWSRSKPWHCQHDVNVVNDSMITVFDNNVVRYHRCGKRNYHNIFLDEGRNRMICYNFAQDTAHPVFDHVFDSQHITSPTGSRAKWLPEDSLVFIESTDEGRLFFHDVQKDTTYQMAMPAPGKGRVRVGRWFRLIE